MKLIYDGKELETGGGGGLTEEEADGRYVKQGMTTGEFIDVAVQAPWDDSYRGESSSLLLTPYSMEIRSDTDAASSIAAINITGDSGEGYPSVSIFAGSGDLESGTELLLENGFYVKISGKPLISTMGGEAIMIGTCAEPETETMPATKGYVDAAVSGAGIPAGVIVMWSGTASAIPSGWALCDGTNGTPDLRDRFVVGAGSTYAVGAKGGEATHTLTVDEMPKHGHRINSSMGTALINYSGGRFWAVEEMEVGSLLHNTDTSGSSSPHNNMPPYYALCYIMKL